ncbi:hypothetical protein DFH11DRAFT_1641003 [Phellopilus nigrolimitatus]|nr:hypothetical protein DFH11DRAFT_1641003 [Phellopilus nigrolimitatus]
MRRTDWAEQRNTKTYKYRVLCEHIYTGAGKPRLGDAERIVQRAVPRRQRARVHIRADAGGRAYRRAARAHPVGAHGENIEDAAAAGTQTGTQALLPLAGLGAGAELQGASYPSSTSLRRFPGFHVHTRPTCAAAGPRRRASARAQCAGGHRAAPEQRSHARAPPTNVAKMARKQKQKSRLFEPSTAGPYVAVARGAIASASEGGGTSAGVLIGQGDAGENTHLSHGQPDGGESATLSRDGPASRMGETRLPYSV